MGLKEVFNHAHSSLQNVVKRCFGILKMKLRILLNLPSYPIEKQSKIIIVVMALHYLIRDSVIDGIDFENYVVENAATQSTQDIFNDGSVRHESGMGSLGDSIAIALLP